MNNLLWLLMPAGGYSAYGVERESEMKCYYTGGVLGTRMNVDIPGVLLLDEVFLIQPGVLRSKILTCLEHKYVYLNEPYFMKSFIR